MTPSQYIQLMFQAFSYGMDYGQYKMRVEWDEYQMTTFNYGVVQLRFGLDPKFKAFSSFREFPKEWQERNKNGFNNFMDFLNENAPKI